MFQQGNQVSLGSTATEATRQVSLSPTSSWEAAQKDCRNICHPWTEMKIIDRGYVRHLGCTLPKKWDQWEVGSLPGGKGPTRVMTVGKDQAFNTPHTLYPVLQRFVHDLSTKETWEQQVPRYGLRSLQLPRFDDWAVHRLNDLRKKGIWSTGQNRWGDFDNGPQAPTWM